MGKELVKTGYFFNAASEGKYNEFGLPQDPANCTKCHSANAATANDFTAKLTADGDNWMSKPSLLACGACHDGINFANGTGVTLADRDADVAASKPVGTTQSGHIGGAKADNTTCNLCHDATTIPISHRTNFATPNNQAAKAGVATFAFDIKSVTLNASKQPVVTFKITQDGVAVTSFAVPTLDTNVGNTNTATPPVTSNIGAVSVSGSYEPIPGFAGGPSFYVAYAVPQDGIATPADFNARQNVSLTNLLIPSGSPKAGSVTGPDANGYFTATLTGDTIGQPGVTSSKSGVVTATPIAPSPIVIPANAKMVTAAMFGSFTQKSAPAPTYTAANVKVNPNVSASGGLARPGILKKLVATGYTARRVITDATKCNACHDQLGTNPSFHGGARNDPTACAICHNGTLTSNGWVADSSTFIHGIHGASKRTVGYTWAGASATDNYSTLGYPGVLKDCDQCHLPNTVNFGAAGATLQPNLLWSTGATGTAYTASNAFRNSPYIVSGTNYGNNFSFTPEGATVAAYTPAGGVLVPAHIAGAGGETVAAQNTTLVSSPISSACFACHDTASAKNHMLTQGGAVYEPRSTALLKGEACLVCHGVGKDKDVAVVHQ
jgi:OmcA/MtrC family decaheme c-type cytochrome